MSRNSSLLDRAIKEQIVLPPEIKSTLFGLNYNLLEGPGHGDFSDESLAKVRDWLENLPTYYYDEDAGILTTDSCEIIEDEEHGEIHRPLAEVEKKTIAQALFHYAAPYI